jgi:hypothetical protein
MKSIISKILSRIQNRIDLTNYFFDRKKCDYQPLPWIGINKAPIRGEATIERWERIESIILDLKIDSLKDIGCMVGYFCHKAAMEIGIETFGIDSNHKFIRIAQHVGNYAKISNGKNHFIEMKVTNLNIGSLPKTDMTLLLSIWHHWVHDFGFDIATQMLAKLWETTNKVLIFEGAGKEVISQFKLPYNVAEETFFENYLPSFLKFSKMEEIGEFDVGNYTIYNDISGKKLKRKVFAIYK